MTSPAPGWYPDPGGAAPFRWWNGQAWTTATSDGAPAAGAQPAAPSAPSTPGYAGADQGSYGVAAQPGFAANPQFGVATEPIPDGRTGGTTAYGTKSAFDASGARVSGGEASSHSHAKAAQDARTNSFFYKNQYAMWTFIIGGVYLFVVIATGFAFIGIVPAWTAYQSFTRGEQLAPIAIGAAAISIVVGLASFANAF